MYGAELDYLLAVHPPSVRIQQYLRSEDFKKKMELKLGDAVIFQLSINPDSPEYYVIGKIRHLGRLREIDGIYFGIEILVSYWIITLCNLYNLYMYLYRRKNIVVKVLLMVLHILIVVLIMLYLLLWIR